MNPSLELKARTLVCFDFDLTLTDRHLFRSVTEMIRSGVSRERACLTAISYLDERGARGGEQLWEVVGAALMRGHGLAVCSFTAYPELAMALLQRGVRVIRAMGATREATAWLSRPIVVYGDPDPKLRPPLLVQGAHLVEVGTHEMHSLGKQRHIARALEVANERLDRSLEQGARFELIPPPSGDPLEPFREVILLDDDPRNIEHAERAGHTGVFVSAPQRGAEEHIERLAELLAIGRSAEPSD